MSNTTNNNNEDLLTQLTASLKSVQTCLEVFADHPHYQKFCQAQKSTEIAAINDKLLQQFNTLRATTQNHLTPSYGVKQSSNKSHNRL
jgi:hypothetical protein